MQHVMLLLSQLLQLSKATVCAFLYLFSLLVCSWSGHRDVWKKFNMMFVFVHFA